MSKLSGFIATPTEEKFEEELIYFKFKQYTWKSGNPIKGDDVDKWAAYYGENTMILIDSRTKTISIVDGRD